MINLRRRVLVSVLALSDLSLLAIALYVSIFGRAALTPLSLLANKRIHVHTIVSIAVLLFAWRSALLLMGLYRSKRLARKVPEVADLLKASAMATILLAAVSVIFHVSAIAPAVIPRFFIITVCTLIVSRLIIWQVLTVLRRRGHNLRHVVVVGTNVRAQKFATGILARPELGYRLVGFVDDSWFGPIPARSMPIDLLSTLSDFRSYLRSHVVDEVVIALPIKSFYAQDDELLRVCREQGIIVRVLTNLFEATTQTTEIDELDPAPIVSFQSIPTESLGIVGKRLTDVIGSSLLLALFSPIMMAAAILVKLDSNGPAIFAQERIGLNKRRFRIYKFRSMVANAETLQTQLESSNEAQGPVFKIRQDPRITRVGRFLRKTSIDELPQLFNVLKGDMSLVGPRPLPMRDFTGFCQDWQRRRFSIRPGITCLWQVSGRSSISFDQWMDLDMEYIDRWSLWLDLKILARTIPAVVRGSGAA
jgi:exopolysaccharide biosynthesis polyprenyl glycosylphosphotransferase